MTLKGEPCDGSDKEAAEGDTRLDKLLIIGVYMATYSIYKDEKVDNTVKNIKSKLKEVGIVLNESIVNQTIKDKNMPCSLRVYLKDINIGTNGKGTCLENALASGYSEFMERIQNYQFPLISRRNFFYSPDEVVCTKKEFEKSIKNLNLGYENFLKEIEKFDNKKVLIPFYSVKNNKIENLPIILIEPMQGTVGMSAGNTYEETLVQGLSEVCERYSMREIILNNISMPEIPKENYWKYDKIRGMIEYLEKYGYKVIIKDASMGKGMPTVLSILENEKDKLFFLSFGAHPSLCVSIERTLTEFAQGLNLSFSKQLKKMDFLNDVNEYKNRKFIFHQLSYTKNSIEQSNKKFLKYLFKKTSSYKFSSDTWIDDNQKSSNKDLLKFLYNRILNITDDIYIRNAGFLNFPALYIYIPKMSLIHDIEELLLLKKYNELCRNIDFIDKISLEELFLILGNEIYMYMGGESHLSFSDEYFALLCSIVRKDDCNIYKYVNILLARNNYKKVLNKEKIWMLNIVKDYYELKNKNYEKEKILEILNQKYSKEEMTLYKNFMSGLTFEIIKKMLKTQNKQKKDHTKVLKNEMLDIEENLDKAYRENIPNQMIFSKIFSDIK